MPENPEVKDTKEIEQIVKIEQIADSAESIVQFLWVAKSLGYSYSELDEYINQLWSKLKQEVPDFSDQIDKLMSLFEEGENIRKKYNLPDNWPDCMFTNVQDEIKMFLANLFLLRFFPPIDSDMQKVNVNSSYQGRIEDIAEEIYKEFGLCSPYATETRTNDIKLKEILIKILSANKLKGLTLSND